MKYLRVTATPDPDAAPELFRLLATSPAVDEARLLTWNFSDRDGVTMLYAVNGDEQAFVETLSEVPEVVDADVTSEDEGRFYVLAEVVPDATALFSGIFETLSKLQLLVLTPVVYRDGRAHAKVVGQADEVQASLNDLPSAIDVSVHEIGERGFERDDLAAALSDRQREAVLVALGLGYYEQPREATHEDVARELGCAPSTASEHLQKAEAKLVRAAMTDERR
ncbi:DNA-binding protein [Halobacteriales archaeon QS_1_68_20]|nr:MAG: DNA-binding protein [Halobacteriales archaeon QS_1_68_20]